MVMIMMMIMMIAGRFRHRGTLARRKFGLARRFQERRSTTGAEIIFLAIGGPASRAIPARGAFGFGGHIHGFFGTLFEGESLHGTKE